MKTTDERYTPPQADLLAIIDAISDLELDGFWNNRRYLVTCNDAFYWGTADCEELTAAEIPALRKAHTDSHDYEGSLLWISRKRGIRPQGAMYASIGREDWPLFDACGPARPSGMGNPIGTDQIEEYIIRKAAQKTTDEPKWQPIESAPMDGTEVLLLQQKRVYHAMWGGKFHDTWIFVTGIGFVDAPTHWMPPLPEPPATEAR